MSTDWEILAALDALPVHRKARLIPTLRQRLGNYYDVHAVKRARKDGVYQPCEQVRRALTGRCPS